MIIFISYSSKNRDLVVQLANLPQPTPVIKSRPHNRIPTALLANVVVVAIAGIGAAGWLAIYQASTPPNPPAPITLVGSETPSVASLSTSAPTPSAVPTDVPVEANTYPPSFSLTPTNISTPSGTPIPTVVDDSQWTPTVQMMNAASMALVPSGCFKMGSDRKVDKDAHADEQPQFQMCFSQPFWIDVNDVTNADYQKFIDAGGYKQQGAWWTDAGWQWLQGDNSNARPHDYPGFTDPNQPRVGIMWYEAYAYCQWRGARLPTEAEWEYAARGPNDPIYPWGFHSADVFDPSKVVSNVGSSQSTSAPVGSKPAGASWVGALDMSGNVFQWTSSIYNARAYGPNYKSNDYESITDTNSQRVLRGSAWTFAGTFLFRAAARNWYLPGGVLSYIGVRCARSY